MSGEIIVVTTTDSRPCAESIAHALVEERLAACVQIGGPITSVYRWKGAVETAEEWICAAKTTARLYDRVEARIRQLHPYDEPEIVAWEIVAGSTGYLDWLRSQVQSAGRDVRP